MQVKLKVLVGKSAGKELPVPVKRFLIGRSDDCHLRPKSDAISRNHCAILTKGSEVVIRDLNSRNGTYVNGEKISEDFRLSPGDQVKVGKLEFEMLITAKEKTPEPEPEAAAPADDNSTEFDVTSWLEEADASARSTRQSDPETRQYKLDETDRIALEGADEEDESDERPEAAEAKPGKKKEPGKLPTRPDDAAATSREAAADMLKKFFNSR